MNSSKLERSGRIAVHRSPPARVRRPTSLVASPSKNPRTVGSAAVVR